LRVRDQGSAAVVLVFESMRDAALEQAQMTPSP